MEFKYTSRSVDDTVRIAQTRPLSKTKRYELVEVIQEAVVL